MNKITQSPDEVLAAYLARLRHVERKQYRARQRLQGWELAHQLTGLCPSPHRHAGARRRVELRRAFLRDLHATLALLRGVAP